MLIETGSNKLAQSIIEALADIRRALEKNADLSKSPSSVSFFRPTYLFLFWEYLCELFIREFRKDTCRIFPKGFFVCIGSFFKEINAKQSLEYWKLHITFSCIFPFLKVRLVQRYFKRGPNAQNKVRLLKDINAKQSPFRYLNTGNYNVFMHFPFSF